MGHGESVSQTLLDPEELEQPVQGPHTGGIFIWSVTDSFPIFKRRTRLKGCWATESEVLWRSSSQHSTGIIPPESQE